jgi:hypothetical protein
MERFNIGVDLHKTQFTICCLSGESFLWEGQYSTNPGGYAEFKRRILGLSKRSKKSSVYLAVESTGNTIAVQNRNSHKLNSSCNGFSAYLDGSIFSLFRISQMSFCKNSNIGITAIN